MVASGEQAKQNAWWQHRLTGSQDPSDCFDAGWDAAVKYLTDPIYESVSGSRKVRRIDYSFPEMCDEFSRKLKLAHEELNAFAVNVGGVDIFSESGRSWIKFQIVQASKPHTLKLSEAG